ncbi:MAG: ATP-binding protein [Bacteroidota bacterium]|nr:ATP-binding protein [Bacteroidota bacterium]
MNKNNVSASGERAAIGGYLPQFDEFATFVYKNLVAKQLEWIKVADPGAEKLDDIQYATTKEIHAYQVKWTIADATISYKNFCDLLPNLASSWKEIKIINPTKIVIPHLITNKSLSLHDSIKSGKIKIGSFNEFISDVWIKIKTKQPVEKKWNPILTEFKKITQLTNVEFNDFIRFLDFQFDYKKKEFKVSNIKNSKEDEDLIQISRFLFEEAGGEKRNVKFTRSELLIALGWEDRFRTIFTHELVVDRQTYQPIIETQNELDIKLKEYEKGYIYLVGGPGTGKSSLLSNWARQRKDRIIKYYAFDFMSPSSQFNFSERGESTTLFFDLVYQLKDAGIYNKDILPYRDITFLKNTFFEQLKYASEDYKESGRKTILIIDGLDHVPREYYSAKQNFLSELLCPNEIPLGVFIILGSQTYDLEDLRLEIKNDYVKGNRTAQIKSLSKKEVNDFLEKRQINLNTEQKSKIFEKTQGHPLYLNYLIENILTSEDVSLSIDSFSKIEGKIEEYYGKIWNPIQKDQKLVDFLGLIARINGTINLGFIQEWDFERSIIRSFSDNAKFLFNQSKNEWNFFHNSFRQFLLQKTTLNLLTGEYDRNQNLTFHTTLANLYKNSKAEPNWKQNYHLFIAEKFEEFITLVTPESFIDQLQNYRPVKEIKQDAKLGIEIARRKKDVVVLVKYLFALAEIERRQYNFDPASLTEELLIFNKITSAKNYLRTDATLLCSKAYALKASRLFYNHNQKNEAGILFNLAYPDEIGDNVIVVTDEHRYEETRNILEEWIYTAPYFLNFEDILSKISNVEFFEESRQNRFQENEADLQLNLLTHLGYALVELNKWDEVTQILNQFDLNEKKHVNSYFLVIESAINECIEINDKNRANEYLTLLTTHFKKESTKPIGKIYIADLIIKVTNDFDFAFSWVSDVIIPNTIDKLKMGYDDSLDEFIPLIKLNKILNLSGNGIPITKAISSAPKGSDEEVLVEFQRMLCLITQILCDGIRNNPLSDDIVKRTRPIIHFYYKSVSHRNSYWYKLTQSKGSYFDFLISAVSSLGKENLEKLGNYLFVEFTENPKYWSSETRRKIIKSLLEFGFNSGKTKEELIKLETFMLKGHDIDGRITECIAHSKIWILLEEYEIAERWIKQAIKESIGVGYRKDYQFSTWIEWLQKINEVEPENASSRTIWYLSQLHQIKESTEGRAYWDASEEILKSTFEWNFHAGFTQLKWQLDNALIDFEEAVSIFIEAYIYKTDKEFELKYILPFYTELLLFISENIDEQLLNKFLDKAYSILEREPFLSYLAKLIKAIQINVLEQYRHSMLSAIEAFCVSKNIKIRDIYPDFEIPPKSRRYESSTSSNELVLGKKHQRLSEDEVIQKVNSYEELLELITKEDQANSYFIWTNVLKKIIHLFDSDLIDKISKATKISARGSEFFSVLSEAALEKGNQELALSLANKSLEFSSSSGWVKYFDGGTRIYAFSAFKKIEELSAFEKAFNIFCHDVVKGGSSASYIENLDDILPLLSKNFSVKTIWPEIFSYLKRLMSNSLPVEKLPILEPSTKPISEILADFIIYLLDHPTFLLKDKAISLLSELIENNDKYSFEKVIYIKPDSQILNDLMMRFLVSNSDKLTKFKEIAQELAISQNYLIRKNACLVLEKLSETIPIPKPQVASEIFNLHLPERKKFKVEKKIDPYYPEIDLNDPEELVSPFGNLIDILSKESGINKMNLYYRVWSIMKKNGSESQWTSEFEKNLRGYLEEIRLKFAYPRPRVIAANRAIQMLTSELIDSGLIEDSDRILQVLRSCDYRVLTFSVDKKPDFVQVLNERDFWGVGSDWLSRIKESSRLKEKLTSVDENHKIIGEYTIVKNLDWGSPTEVFMSQIAADEFIDEDDHFIFGSVFHRLTDDYYRMSGVSDMIVVVRDHRYNQFDLKSHWIAINPDLARFLGWVPEQKKLFGWKDNQGNLMVESIYWANGNIDMVPRKDSEVGEGWYIVVSVEGLSQIQKTEPNLVIQKSLTREKYEETGDQANMVYKVMSL